MNDADLSEEQLRVELGQLRHFQHLFERAPDAMFLMDDGSRFVEVNAAGCDLTGYSIDELLQMSMLDLITTLDHVPKTHQPQEVEEYTLKCKDGQTLTVECHTVTQVAAGRHLCRMRNISEGKQKNLQESEELQRIILENILDLVFITDDDGNFRFVGPNVLPALGYTVAEVQAMGHISKLIDDAIVDHEELNRQGRIVDKQGRQRVFLITVKRISLRGGTVLYACRDVTECKQAEERLRRYEHILAATPSQVSLVDRNYIYRVVNEAYLQQRGRQREEIEDHPVADVMGEDVFQAIVKPNLDRCLAGETVRYQEWFEYEIAGRRYMDVIYSPYRSGDDSIAGILVSARDITELREAEIALREREELFRTLMHLAPVGVYMTDADGHCSYANHRWLEMAGLTYEEALGSGWADALHPDDRDLVASSWYKMVASRGYWALEYRFQTPDGITRWVQGVATPLVDQLGQISGYLGINTDINERILSEQALRESEERYRVLVEASPSGIWVVQDGYYIFTNLSGAHMLGYASPEEVVGKKIADTIAPEYLEQILAREARVYQGEANLQIECGLLQPDGSVRFIEATSAPIRLQGKPAGLIVSQDIMERRKAEKALHDSKARLSAFIKALPDLSFVMDQDGQYVEILNRQNHLLYLEADRLLGRQVHEVLPKPVADTILAAIQSTIRTGRGRIIEYELDVPAGHCWFEGRTSLMNNADEENARVVLLARDITERKRAEEALQTSADIVQSMPSGLFIYQYHPPDQLILIQANSEAERLTGIKTQEWMGREFNDLWPEARADGLTATCLDVVRTGQTFEIEDQAYEDDRLTGVFKIRAFRMPGDRLGVAFENVTAQKRAEAELAKYRSHLEELVKERTVDLEAVNQRLEALSRVKDEFVSNVSHELRTPITNLILRQHVLQKRPHEVDIHLPVMQREVHRLSNTIDDLLTLSRLDQERTQLHLVPLELNRLVSQQVIDRSLLAAEHKLELSVVEEGVLPPMVGDEGLINQVLSILLTNAINYTPPGGQVSVRTHSNDFAQRLWVGFSIMDTGPGISPQEQSHLFERFFRGQAGLDSRVPGTGLGLALAKEIVDRHHGYIEVESAGLPGKGSTFRVWFPAEGETA